MDNQTLALIGIGVLLIVSLVIAYLASKTWGIGQVILVYAIFLSASVFLYLAAKTLKIQQTYRQQAKQFEQRAEQLEKENAEIEFGVEAVGGGEAKPGIEQLRHELDKLTLVRGGVWRGCKPAKVAKDGTAVVRIPDSGLATLGKDTIVFAFEEGEGERGAGARYLTEFKVTAVDPQTGSVTLTPATIPRADELKRLADSRRTWSLYEVLPVDRHEVFATLDADRLKALIPPESLEEYLRDGKAAKEDDPPDRVIGVLEDGTTAPLAVLEQQGKLDQVVEKRYQRPLRDYAFALREFSRQRAIDEDAMAQLLRDQQQLNESLAQAKKDIAYRQDEKKQLEADLKGFTFERDVVAAYLKDVQALSANVQTELERVTAHNGQLAGQLAQLQADVARRIDQRTEAAAAGTP